jgi:hypothetical protein
MVSDNSGTFFSISITPDDRWSNVWTHISSTGISITNFEVVQTTGTNEGPRSPGAPVANAGADQTVPIFQAAQLQGVVTFSNPAPIIQWKSYSGPGTVTFGNAAQTNTTASFSAPGIYTLELSADDGSHAVAYDALIITVTNAIRLTIAPAGTNVNISWLGGLPPFVLEKTPAFPAAIWSGVVTTSVQNVVLPITNSATFFRVRGQ